MSDTEDIRALRDLVRSREDEETTDLADELESALGKGEDTTG